MTLAHYLVLIGFIGICLITVFVGPDMDTDKMGPAVIIGLPSLAILIVGIVLMLMEWMGI